MVDFLPQRLPALFEVIEEPFVLIMILSILIIFEPGKAEQGAPSPTQIGDKLLESMSLCHVDPVKIMFSQACRGILSEKL